MSTPLPANLHPFSTNHPASCAYRMHLSPHEWTWTQVEQEVMANAIITLDAERAELRRQLAECAEVAREDHTCGCQETGWKS